MIQKNVLHITWDIVKTMYDVLFDDKNFMRLVHQCSSKQILSIRSHPIMTTWNKFFHDKDIKIKTKNKEED
jgi:aromatic ring-cleaving dioxygenase